ncbi:MAG TPA: Nif3-like dinuclear metal center hexameric protein [Flavobacteriales bacterium]|nr:Nif3-like dinuclear metal center hexameric protein [Flavobacteriales bacterium]HRJ38379.1 Nif3-like dinuclear metal center hexameric protein [Flavobacteriales bacterium]
MKISALITFLEEQAPLRLQESYDNSGLICGNPDSEIESVLIALDCTEEIIEEARKKGCGMVISHHPIVFKGLKRFTGSNYVERTIISAIKNDIAIYAIHTNLDHVNQGVNRRICDKIGLDNQRILEPKTEQLLKLGVYVPADHAEAVRSSLFAAGAGRIGNYSDCSFNLIGEGTFKATEGADPFVGEVGKRHSETEIRIEVVFPFWLEKVVMNHLRKSHPYEEIAYDLIQLKNSLQTVGAGMIGELPESMTEAEFLSHLKQNMNLKVIRHTSFCGKNVKKVAVCGGSGSFLIGPAISSGSDFYVTADVKYHEFFDAEGKLVIADIGHFESERFTIDLLGEWISEKFPTFAVRLTETNTNPINYF